MGNWCFYQQRLSCDQCSIFLPLTKVFFKCVCHLPYNGVTMYLHCISVQTIFFTKHIFLKSWRLCIYMISRKYAEWAKKMTMKLNIRLKNDLRKWIHMFIWLYIDPHMFIWLYIYWSMTFKVNYWGETREFIFLFSASFHQERECSNLLQNNSHNSKETEILLFTIVIFYGSFDLWKFSCHFSSI